MFSLLRFVLDGLLLALGIDVSDRSDQVTVEEALSGHWCRVGEHLWNAMR